MLLVSTVFLAIGATNGMIMYQKDSEGTNLGTFGGHLPEAVKVIKVTKTVAVPYPYPIPFDKHIPFPVSVPKLLPYAVPQPIPVQVTKPVLIQQAVPFEVPKPYPVPQPYTVKSPQQSQISMSFPSELLMAPQYHENQANDYQAYLNYNGGSPSVSSSSSSYGQDQSFNAHQLFGDQEGLRSQNMFGVGTHGGFGSQSESESQGSLGLLRALGLLGGLGTPSGLGSHGGSTSAQSVTGTQSGAESQSQFGSPNMFVSQNGYGYTDASQGMFSAVTSVHENTSPMMTQGLYSSSDPMQMQYNLMFSGVKHEDRGNQEINFGQFEVSNSIDNQGALDQLRGY